MMIVSHRLSRMVIVLGIMLACVAMAFAQTEKASTVPEQLAEAVRLYSDLEFEKALAVANDLLARPGLTTQDSVAILEVLSIVNYAKGVEFQRKAFSYLEQISKIGPCVLQLPRDIWPQELRTKWFRLTNAKDSLVCHINSEPNVKTIAILPFDNYSVGKYQQELGMLSKALSEFMVLDFLKLGTMKVVERDKIDFIMKELELQKSGAVDQATAAKIGKIVGAQYMVFGSITQLDDKTAAMLARVVKVETSEIVASADVSGKPEYLKMQKDLVADLAKRLDGTLGNNIRQLIQDASTETMDAAKYYSQGLELVDQYEYKKAYDAFKKAYEMDKTFAEAKKKMDVYRPLAG